MARLDPQRLMRLAVEVMKQSVSELRPDGKPSPKVGATLWKPDGTVETACRGELRSGDHAEFTLLERKNRQCRLDGAVLFATLEPCAPGSRHSPKLSCAERIVLARIKDVYVGVEDDNPTIAGKGIEYLRRHGVSVQMFDRDLQEEILAENKAFFEWARRQPPRAADQPITLSAYEDAVEAVELTDLSPEALERYRAAAGIEPAAAEVVNGFETRGVGI